MATEEELDNATPLDLLNNDNYTTREIRDARLEICKNCEHIFKPTRTCKICYCFMAAKTWIKHAHCPVHKWEAVDEAD